MSDLIRKAVELADGFEWDDNTLTGNFFIGFPLSAAERRHQLRQHWREADDTVALDALAAQLVRQVDALEWDTIIWRNGTGIYDRLLEAQTHINGPDRTMNTIKAIVESGVLE